MKKSLSRSEWWLLLAPGALLLAFGVWMTLRSRETTTFASAPSPLAYIRWSRDGHSIYGLAESKDRRIPTYLQWNVATGELRRTLNLSNGGWSYNLSSDGRYAMVSGLKETRLIETTAGSTLWEIPRLRDSGLDWAPQGSLFRFTNKGQLLESLGIVTGATTRKTRLDNLLPDGKGFHSLRFSLDGKHVALFETITTVRDQTPGNNSFESGGRVVIASWHDLKPVMQIPVELAVQGEFGKDGKIFRAISHIKDGTRILATLISSTDLTTRKTRWTTLDDAQLHVTAGTFARDGQLLLSWEIERGFAVYSTQSGKKLGQLGAVRTSRPSYPDFMFSISEDGNSIVRNRGSNIEILDLKSYVQ